MELLTSDTTAKITSDTPNQTKTSVKNHHFYFTLPYYDSYLTIIVMVTFMSTNKTNLINK